MRELELIKDKQEVILCTTMALVFAHKRAKLVDREAVQELEAKLRQDRTGCGELALYFGGMFLWHTGRHDKAREYVDRMIKMAPNSKEVFLGHVFIINDEKQTTDCTIWKLYSSVKKKAFD